MIWGSDGRHLFLAGGEGTTLKRQKLTSMTVFSSNRILGNTHTKKRRRRKTKRAIVKQADRAGEVERKKARSNKKREKKRKKTKEPHVEICCGRFKAIVLVHTCHYLLRCYGRVRPPDDSTDEAE